MTADGSDSDAGFDMGPIPDRRLVDADLVARLVATQFPQWAGLEVRPVPNQGWDNQTFRLGADLLVRLPTASEYALAVEKEHRWLPELAPHLRLPIPTPLALGAPTEEFPHRWSVRGWLDGTPLGAAPPADAHRFSGDLAEFLVDLRRIDPAAGPGPGVHNWFRGGSLRTFEPTVVSSLQTLGDRVDVGRVRAVWQSALDARWDRRPKWFHGDIAGGNLLVSGGRLAAVIDFGTCGVGDPACDLAIAWTLLSGGARDAFRERLAVDAREWARGRGWALWKVLATCAASDRSPELDDELAVLDRVLAREVSPP